MNIPVRLVSLDGSLPAGFDASGEGTLELAEGTTLAALLSGLKLPPEGAYAALVNGETIAPEARDGLVLGDGDEVVVFPPISGGGP